MAATLQEATADWQRRKKEWPITRRELTLMLEKKGVRATDKDLDRLDSRNGGPLTWEQFADGDDWGFRRDIVFEWLDSQAGEVFVESHQYRAPVDKPFDVKAAIKNAVPENKSLLSREVC